jgi:hypothetical protein
MVYDAGEELVVEPMAKVRVSMGLTIQIAPYNTARLSLEVEEECTADEVEEVQEQLYEQLEHKLFAKLDKLAEGALRTGLVR